ncbi:MAG TPA: LysE family transporter [Chitinophagaceae bacterium]|nr:LysE family transporter [Chitinophagaceae bacterium]
MIAPLIKGFALALVLAISVGPVVFSIIKQSMSHGHRGGYLFIAGVSLSDITLVLVCNLFSSLFQSAMTHEKIIGGIGIIFLTGMGIYNIFFKKVSTADQIDPKEKVYRRRELFWIFASGFLMNTFNPSVFLFWFTVSATMLADSKSEPHPVQYRIIVFTSCLIFMLASDIAKVLLANRIRRRLTPHNIHIINQISGGIFIIFAGVLFFKFFV